jgi:hypothetical protein
MKRGRGEEGKGRRGEEEKGRRGEGEKRGWGESIFDGCPWKLGGALVATIAKVFNHS